MTVEDRQDVFEASAGAGASAASPSCLERRSPAPTKEPLPNSGQETEAYELPVLTMRAGSETGDLGGPAKSEEQIRKELRVERISLGALMLSMFMEGWNDGTSGPMLPAMQKYYKVRDKRYVSSECSQLRTRLGSRSSR